MLHLDETRTGLVRKKTGLEKKIGELEERRRKGGAVVGEVEAGR